MPAVSTGEKVLIERQSGAPLEGVIRNVHPGGINVFISEYLQPRTPVRLHIGPSIFNGLIDHCSRVSSGYVAGVDATLADTPTGALAQLARAIDRA